MSEKKEKQERTIEQSLALLEEMAKRMENENVPLDEAFAIYEQGMQLLKEVNEKIDRVEKKIAELDKKQSGGSGEGGPQGGSAKPAAADDFETEDDDELPFM